MYFVSVSDASAAVRAAECAMKWVGGNSRRNLAVTAATKCAARSAVRGDSRAARRIAEADSCPTINRTMDYVTLANPTSEFIPLAYYAYRYLDK